MLVIAFSPCSKVPLFDSLKNRNHVFGKTTLNRDNITSPSELLRQTVTNGNKINEMQ